MNKGWLGEAAANTRQRECSWPGNLPLREVRRAGSHASKRLGEWRRGICLEDPLELKRKKWSKEALLWSLWPRESVI